MHETLPMTPPLGKLLEETARAVEAVIRESLPRPDQTERRLYEAMTHALFAGGKRLRPFLVISTADLFDTPRSHSLRVAAAVEMIHTYSLIHDDLPAMDDDDLRRGQPTCHIRYGEAAAILAGDALQTLAFQILAVPQTHPEAEVRCQLIEALAIASGGCGMVGGQMIDLESEYSALDMDAITRLQTMKTGDLITFSCIAGALLGKADAKQTQALCQYAHDLGLAFQIHDDWLDATSNTATLGKRASKDQKAGKATFVSMMGADQARSHALTLIDQAIHHLTIFGKKATRLEQLTRFVIERNH